MNPGIRWHAVALSLLALTIGSFVARAQTAKDPAVKSDESLSVPPTPAAQGTSLKLDLGQNLESRLTGGLNFTGMYTNNVFLTPTDHQSDMSYDIQPYISWQEFTSRLSLDLSGGAGFVVNQRFNETNQATENFSVNLTSHLRRYVTLRLDNSFVNTTGLFSGTGAASDQSGIGVVQQANSTLITPASHILTNTSLAEVNYQFNSTSNVGVRGVASILRYPDGAQSVTNVPLYEGESYAAEVFYNHQVTTRQWTGVTLRWQRFDAQSSLVTTDADSVLFFYSIQPTTAINISLFGGPQLTTSHVAPSLASTIPPFNPRSWTPATGATLAWQKSHTSAHVSYIREANDGGGLFSAVTNETVQAGIRQQLSQRQQVTFAFTYADNQTLVPGVTLRGFSGQGEFSRRLTGSLSAGLGYRFEQQGQTGATAPGRASRGWFSFSYEFSRPLGH